MHQFDIRITGETADPVALREAVQSLIIGVKAHGGSIHHGSLDGQEIRVPVVTRTVDAVNLLLDPTGETDAVKELTDAIDADNAARRPDSAGNL